MNATARPQRRRKSSLASEHPAYPAPSPNPPGEDKQRPSEANSVEHSREDARTRAREDEQAPERQSMGTRPRRSTADEARSRKLARDAAFGWAAAMRKADKRADEWAREMSRAREAGALPGVLRDYIGEAAERVGIDPSSVPDEVWHAAGLD